MTLGIEANLWLAAAAYATLPLVARGIAPAPAAAPAPGATPSPGAAAAPEGAGGSGRA
jgi:hypothetical protein